MEKKNAIAIVCGGGPAPGMNSVISGIVAEATRIGWDVYGIYEGFNRISKGQKSYIKLEQKNLPRLHRDGGCMLMMSRYNPTKKEEDLKNVVDTLLELGVNYLVTIGGDDTAFSSSAVSAYAQKIGSQINVVHVPKTIDNDLPLKEGVPTFGYETARALGAVEVGNLAQDAATANNRWYIPIAMGRTAGHLALGIGQSAAAQVTIIPEEFKAPKISLQQVVDIMASSVVKRNLQGTNYGVAVVAEGVIEKIDEEDLKKCGNIVLDEHGHIRYSELDFGDILKTLLVEEATKLGVKISVVDKEIGYELRCNDPIPYDIEYGRNLGSHAVKFLASGDSGAIISLQDNQAVPLRFEDIKDPATGKTKVRRVNIDSVTYTTARDFMLRLEKEDLDNPEILKAYGMDAAAMKARYGYLFE